MEEMKLGIKEAEVLYLRGHFLVFPLISVPATQRSVAAGTTFQSKRLERRRMLQPEFYASHIFIMYECGLGI